VFTVGYKIRMQINENDTLIFKNTTNFNLLLEDQDLDLISIKAYINNYLNHVREFFIQHRHLALSVVNLEDNDVASPANVLSKI